MVKQTNLAYDLSRYEYQAKKEQPVIKVKRNVQKNASVPKVVAGIFVAGLLMCCVLYGKVEVSTLQNQIAAETENNEMLNSENVRMRSEIEGRTSLQKVEDYAENVLGLKKLEKTQVEYVQLKKDSEIEISESGTNIFVKIKNKFYDILEYLKG